MIINKGADSQVIRDIENMFQMVELETSLVKLEYIPKGKNNSAKLKDREMMITAFKAGKYREWIHLFAPRYAEEHPYLHFQFARIVTLADESLIQVMTRLRNDFNKVTLADRAEYAAEAQTIQAVYKTGVLTKRTLH